MKRSQILPVKLILLFPVILLFTGCAAPVTIQEQQKISVKVGQYPAVLLSVDGTQDIKSQPGFAEAVGQLQQSITQNMAQKNLSKNIIHSDKLVQKNAALEMKVVIVDFNHVSAGSSIMLGIMSGNARMTVNVTLTDLKNNIKAGEFMVAAHTESSGGIFRGDTSKVVEAISTQIASKLAEYN